MLSKRILIAEDETPCRTFLRDNLKHDGYECIALESGRKALESVALFRPDLALVDIQMPGMDGITLLGELRKKNATARIPVIFVTGMNVPGAMLQATSAGLGSVPVVIKTEGYDRILAAIRSVLSGASKQGSVYVDRNVRRVWIGGREIALRGRCFDLFHALFSSPTPLSRRELKERIWPNSPDDRIVPVNIHRLRHQLRKQILGADVDLIDDLYKLSLDDDYNCN